MADRRRDGIRFGLIAIAGLIVQTIVLYVSLARNFNAPSRSHASDTSVPRPDSVIDLEAAKQADVPPIEPKATGLSLQWDVVGLISVAVALIGSAVFFMAGWVYEAHWYGHYGIEISQIHTDPQQMMIQGVPGILVLSGSFLVSLALVAIGRRFLWSVNIGIKDVPLITVGAYIISVIVMLAFTPLAVDLNAPDRLPLEVKISLGAVAILVILSMAVYSLTQMMEEIPLSFTFPIPMAARSVRPARFTAWRRVIEKLIHDRQTDLLKNVLVAVFDNDRLNKGVKEDVDRIEVEILADVEKQRVNAIQSVANTWRFWLSTIVVLFFLVSVSVSALLGEYDARRGARSLSGNWQLPQVWLFSKQELDVLQTPNTQTVGSSKVYGPLGLVTSTDANLYLIKWKEKEYFDGPPMLYIVPRDNSQQLRLELPTPTPTPTPAPTPIATPSPGPIN